MCLVILKGKKLLQRFTKKKRKKNLKEFRVEKIIKRKDKKVLKYTLNGKVRLIKKTFNT